ncbi:nuclear transport factor 2 family protein [Seongchinamella unica]|uniref:Nuclear transport factor 2 family protein n=1 Tax=Seongchinamella unica TaxID=2547392 RepID=A0A4R5LVF8_9GAMM|nr:nuclear transport factor 2 family protein [Seongchinamella unica]TDG15337.1 nuclear transport factor 2 family protein [Seongchinamella unica]
MNLTAEQKLEIHELLSRASYAYDTRDTDMLASCFAEDATMSMRIAGGELAGPFVGRDAIMELMAGSMAQQTDVRRHVVSNLFFLAGAAGIRVNSFLTLIATENSQTALLTTGVYQDTVVQDEAGNWRLSARHLDLDNAY